MMIHSVSSGKQMTKVRRTGHRRTVYHDFFPGECSLHVFDFRVIRSFLFNTLPVTVHFLSLRLDFFSFITFSHFYIQN